MFDPTTPSPERTPLLPDVTQYLDKPVDDIPVDLCERIRIRLAIIGCPLEDWVGAPSTNRRRALELADEEADLRARWDEQETEREAERIACGRFKLCEIVLMLEATGEDKRSFLQKLQDAARDKALPMYRPGEEGRLDYIVKDDNGIVIETIPVRDFHEEARWDEINAWLEKHERRVRVRFIALPGVATSQAASRPPTDEKFPQGFKKERHVIRRRGNPLTVVVEKAKGMAEDSCDPHSVWAAFVKLARSDDRPAPLLGFADDEGVKWESDGNTKFLTKKGFMERWRRAKSR